MAYLTDPKNPNGAKFGERLYGHIGEYFPWELRQENPLSVRYRWWISASHKVAREQAQLRYEDLAHPPVIRLEE